MKVKKFVCHKCGAPKVNPYKGVYVICDYCNTIVDIDYASSYEEVKNNPAKMQMWSEFMYRYQTENAEYSRNKNKKAHRQLQYEYCKTYFTAFLASLPPNIPNGEVLEEYCQASADFMTEFAFNTEIQQAKTKYESLWVSIQYYDLNGQTKAKYEDFDKMLDAYMDMLKLELKCLYGNSQYEIFMEYYPEEFNRKQRISQIAQTWIPYLEEKEGDEFLVKYNMKQEYVEINPPALENIKCEECKQDLSVPVGAITCVCQNCRHQNNLKANVNCQSCGMENPLPAKWKMMIDCSSCGTELRVVQPLFG